MVQAGPPQDCIHSSRDREDQVIAGKQEQDQGSKYEEALQGDGEGLPIYIHTYIYIYI